MSVRKPGKLSPQKDSNGGKLGQFTTEVHKTKAKAFLKGFLRGMKRGVAFVNWTAFFIGLVLGSALMGIAKSV